MKRRMTFFQPIVTLTEQDREELLMLMDSMYIHMHNTRFIKEKTAFTGK